MLQNEKIQQKYSKNICEYIKSIELNDIDKDWVKVRKAIKEIAAENMGNIRRNIIK